MLRTPLVRPDHYRIAAGCCAAGHGRVRFDEATGPWGRWMAMSANVTLRGLLGLGDAPAALQDSALIMIDCQNTYRRGVMQLEGAEDALAEAARMLARARALGVPVFHIMHDAGQGSPYDITAEIGQISEEVAPIAGGPVVVKHFPSSFFQTDLGAQ